MAVKKNSEARALKRYLETDGKVSFIKIAKELGINRQTVGVWSRKYNWDAKLAETRQATAAKMVEQISSETVDSISATYEETNKIIAQLDEMIRDSLFKRNEDTNEFLTDADGKYIPLDNLGPNDFVRLTQANKNNAETKSKIVAATGGGEGKDGSRFAITQDGDTPGYLDEVIQKIIKTGDIDGQNQIMKIQEALQGLIGKGRV